ncbi:MAG TPA: MFS transporter [Methanomassiliicoccales archaeon]|nr:MFS transporter [Methanomassiliicoccales archaeon]
MSNLGPDPLRVYIINQTVHWLIVGLVFPILVLFVLAKGLDIFEASLVMSGYSITTIALELPTGGLADAIGRKRVYLLSLAVTLIGYVMIVLVSGFVLIFVSAAVMGAARALSSGSIEAWFIDEFHRTNPHGNLQHALARAGFFIPLGIGLGSLIGGAIPSVAAAFSSDVLGNPYAMNFVVAAVIAIIQAALTAIMVKEAQRPFSKGAVMESLRSTPRIIGVSVELGMRNRITRMLIIAMTVLGFAIAGLELLWQPQVSEILGETSETWVLGVLAAAYFLASSLGSLVSPTICEELRNSYALVLLLSRIGTAGALIALSFQQGIFGFAVFYILIYFITGVEDSPHSTLFNQQVPSQHRSTLISFKSLMLQLGGVAGSVTLGWVANTYNIATAWQGAGIVLAASSIAYLALVLELRNGHEAEANT